MPEPLDTTKIDASNITAADPWPISLIDSRTGKTLAVWKPDGTITLNHTDGTPVVTLTWNQLVDTLTLHFYHLEQRICPETRIPG